MMRTTETTKVTKNVADPLIDFRVSDHAVDVDGDVFAWDVKF